MTPKQEAALRLALEVLEGIWNDGLEGYPSSLHRHAITVIDEALAEQPPCKTGSQCTSKCERCRYKYECDKAEQPANVAAVNTSSERVDKTAKNVHEQPTQQEQLVCTTCQGQGRIYQGCGSWIHCPNCNATGKVYTSPPASKPLTDKQIEKKFEEFAAQYDTLGDAWQDMGANDYFRAGFKAALGIKGDE